MRFFIIILCTLICVAAIGQNRNVQPPLIRASADPKSQEDSLLNAISSMYDNMENQLRTEYQKLLVQHQNEIERIKSAVKKSETDLEGYKRSKSRELIKLDKDISIKRKKLDSLQLAPDPGFQSGENAALHSAIDALQKEKALINWEIQKREEQLNNERSSSQVQIIKINEQIIRLKEDIERLIADLKVARQKAIENAEAMRQTIIKRNAEMRTITDSIQKLRIRYKVN